MKRDEPSAPAAMLLRALARAPLSNGQANDLVVLALRDASLDEVPSDRDAFERFFREDLAPRLMPLLRLDAIHDLLRRTIGVEGSIHPPPLRPHGSVPREMEQAPTKDRGVRPRVVLVEADTARRVAIARALVRDRLDVEAIEHAADLLVVPAAHVLIAHLDTADAEATLLTLADGGTRAGLVIHDTPAVRDAIARIIGRWPTDRVALAPTDASPALISARVRIALG